MYWYVFFISFFCWKKIIKEIFFLFEKFFKLEGEFYGRVCIWFLFWFFCFCVKFFSVVEGFNDLSIVKKGVFIGGGVFVCLVYNNFSFLFVVGF